ncbi:MAG: protein arginine kinase [Gemmatimonadota bacterium]|nr:protein arginine kinase [Gemmatimonadota bacterium]
MSHRSDDLLEPVGGGFAWISGEGPHPDVILSTRIRLARNLEGFPFRETITAAQQQLVTEDLLDAISETSLAGNGGYQFLRLSDLGENDRTLLLERHLVSQEMINFQEASALVVGDSGRLALLMNEEDHLRIQVLTPGLQLEGSWEIARRIERSLRDRLQFAYHHRFGFLTSCPTNTGTGLRASVLIHLPGLVLTREIHKVLDGLSQIGLTFRGLYGEGSDVIGNYFQLSNQTTLGKSEEELIGHLAQITRQVIEYEENARQVLARDALDEIEDKVWRAYGLLRFARSMSFDEMMNLLSAVRLGVSMKLLPDIGVSKLNKLLLWTQVAHLQKRAGRTLDKREREIERASLIREILDTEVGLEEFGRDDEEFGEEDEGEPHE